MTKIELRLPVRIAVVTACQQQLFSFCHPFYALLPINAILNKVSGEYLCNFPHLPNVSIKGKCVHSIIVKNAATGVLSNLQYCKYVILGRTISRRDKYRNL